MKFDFLNDTKGLAILAGLGVAGYLIYKISTVKIPTPGAVAAAAGAAVNGAAVATVGGIGATVGLPTPDQTETDPAVARYLIDQLGYFTASQWTSAGALIQGALMSSGSGTPPAAGAPVWSVLGGSTPAPVQGNPLTGSNVGLQANDAATALYSNPNDYGASVGF